MLPALDQPEIDVSVYAAVAIQNSDNSTGFPVEADPHDQHN
jgi:hypothetical protein